MRGYPIIFGEGVDPDAYQYFLRAGIASGTQTPTAYDNAASFNGTNQFLSIPSNSSLQVGGQAFSFSIWFNASNAAVNNVFVSKVGAGPSLEYQMGTLGSNLRILIGNGSTGWIVNPVAGTFVTNTWNHAVFTYNGTNATIYLNGTSVGTGTGSITTSGTNQLQIGNNSPYGEKMAGALSSIGFWKKALTASEVTALFNSGAGRTYASLDSGLLTNLISWWALNQNSVTADSHGTNTLTNSTPAVTAPNIGPIVTTTQNSRQLINNFVRGIKSLGLWNSMVCWPLRASQNASTTLTARSLGGLGTFDAPMTGLGTASAAWGTNGVNISGSGYLAPSSTPLTASNSVRSQLAVWNNTGGGTVIPLSSSGLPPVRFALRSNSRTTASLDVWDGSGGDFFGNQSVPSGFNQSAATYNHATGLLTFNANQGSQTTATRTITFSSGNITLGSWDTGFFTNNSFLLAFALIANVEMSRDTLNAVNNLYRQTLGIGLNLP
jgi:hypothetical protein